MRERKTVLNTKKGQIDSTNQTSEANVECTSERLITMNGGKERGERKSHCSHSLDRC